MINDGREAKGVRGEKKKQAPTSSNLLILLNLCAVATAVSSRAAPKVD